jgi:acyl-CoA synthetase (AMP-forming)/AMP-acid ligase II
LASDPALLVYTSGTTGEPKGALLPHRGLCRGNRTQTEIWSAEPIRTLNFLPINHIGCVGDIGCYTLVGGGTIVFQEKFDPLESLKILERDRITVWIGVPAALQMTIEHPQFREFDLSAIQLIVWGGAAASTALIQSLLEICPRVTTSYGQTESTCSVTFIEPTDDMEHLSGSVGTPVPEYDFRIADEDGNSLPSGETGEVQVRGDFIMVGYWNRSDATRDAIDDDGWLHTGDLGLIRSDGSLQLVGRSKEMYISGGYNVYPREIENLIETIKGVVCAAVVGVPDKLFGEVGHAYVQIEVGTGIEEKSLSDFCRSGLANYKVPKRFFVESELPVLPIGKIDKMKLRKRSEDHVMKAADDVEE